MEEHVKDRTWLRIEWRRLRVQWAGVRLLVALRRVVERQIAVVDALPSGHPDDQQEREKLRVLTQQLRAAASAAGRAASRGE
jgi:hypothetical protein